MIRLCGRYALAHRRDECGARSGVGKKACRQNEAVPKADPEHDQQIALANFGNRSPRRAHVIVPVLAADAVGGEFDRATLGPDALPKSTRDPAITEMDRERISGRA